MARIIVAFIAGLLFSCGLVVANMVNPNKVLAFLDIFGQWDPSLALVMLGAVMTLSGLQFLIFKRTRPLLESKFYLPELTSINTRLLVGAAIFGIGWGLAGLCPGPALANISTGSTQLIAFILAMIAGMGLANRIN